VGKGAGDIWVKLVEALQNFFDALLSQWIVGWLFRRAGCLSFAPSGTAEGDRPHKIPFAGARLFKCCLRGQEGLRYTVLTTSAGGLTGHVAAGHEGNILAETSVTTGMID
jgi:hypothetical protein